MKISKWLTGLFVLGLASSAIAKSIEKPNVLLIFTDDHRYSGIHALANMPVQTPNLDQLANQGIIFDNTYLMGAFVGATCMPSRAMLHSGKNLFHLKALGRHIPDSDKTMGETFQAAGYKTHIVGKWHQNGNSLKRSFQSGKTIFGRGFYMQDHFRMAMWDLNEKKPFQTKDAFIHSYDENGNVYRRPFTKEDAKTKGPRGTEKDGPHTSEVIADSAIEYIKAHQSDQQPFFLYAAFHAPHDPRQAPQKYRDLYPLDNMDLPPAYLPQHPFDNGHMAVRDEALAPWPRTPDISKQELADYYAIITHMDAQIGRVIQTLKETGQYENTIIVMSGDSGLAVGSHGLMGKQNIYDEAGIHVPLIISGKIKGHGKRFNALSYIHDIYPTICDLAGVKYPKTLDGKSLKGVIDGKVSQVRDSTYHAYRQHQRAFRKGDFKLIEYVKAPDETKQDGQFVSGSRVTQLFNIKDDPWETTDLSFLPQYAATVKKLRKEMKQEAVRLGDNSKQTGYKFDFWDYYQ